MKCVRERLTGSNKTVVDRRFWTLLVSGLFGIVGLSAEASGLPAQMPAFIDSRPVTAIAPAAVQQSIRESRQHSLGKALHSSEQKTAEVLLSQSFEGSWPDSLWTIEHGAGAEVDWGNTTYRASKGVRSIWCAQTGPDSPGAGGSAPANTTSWTIVGPFQLTDTTTGSFSFSLWLQSEPFHDFFMALASVDGEEFHGEAHSGNSDGWQPHTVDLSDWPNLGSLTGQEEVWFAFIYKSDHSEDYEGAYIDFVVLDVDNGEEGQVEYTYSSDADFEQGTMIGLEAVSDSLQITSGWNALPYLWVPNSSNGTVSKIAVDSGDELARYRTGPEGELDPSAVAVDLFEDCWVGNRGAGSVVKIGLSETFSCIDRNGNGTIETSTDADDDGDISEDELLAWGDDECVLFEALLVDGFEGVASPGSANENYAPNNLQGLAVDEDNDVWVGVYDSQRVYQIDGQTGEVLKNIDVSESDTHPFDVVVDGDGAVWVASRPDPWVLIIDPVTELQAKISLGHQSSALALDNLSHLFVTGYTDSSWSRINVDSGEVDWTQGVDWGVHGVVSSEDSSVWVAAPGSQILRRYTNGGAPVFPFELANQPTALAVDANGLVWVAGLANGTLVRLDPLTNTVNLEKEVLDSDEHDAIGDMTGIVSRSLTTTFGSWHVVVDSEQEGTSWSAVTWDATEPNGTSVTAVVRSSDDEIMWSDKESAESGVELHSTPPGRYLRVELGMQVTSGDEVPAVNEVVVTPTPPDDAPVADFDWDPQSPVAGEQVTFTDESTGNPTTWSWTFGDGGTSSEQNPVYSYAADGQYDVVLEVSNSTGSNDLTQTITVEPLLQCELTCSATAPETGLVDEGVSFVADAEATGCSGQVQFNWDFGNGGTSTEQNPAFVYSGIGMFEWSMTASVDGESCAGNGTIEVDYGGPDECLFVYWVPVASRVSGALGSLWRSDLGLLRGSGETAKVTVLFHGPSGVQTRNIHVGRLDMVEIADVVGWVSLEDNVSGAVEICSDGDLVVASRTFNQIAADDPCTPNGTFGQRLEGAESVDGLIESETAVLPQLRENAGFRTNLGFTNTGTIPAEIEVVLYDSLGTPLVGYSVQLDPGEWKQDNRPYFHRAEVVDIDAGWAKVTVTTGAGVFAYASVIDNITNDAATVVMRE